MYPCQCLNALTGLCDERDAALNYYRYVCVSQLLLAQCVSATPCCRLDGFTPASKIQLPFSFYVQSSKRVEGETTLNKTSEEEKDKNRRERHQKVIPDFFILRIIFKVTTDTFFPSNVSIIIHVIITCASVQQRLARWLSVF